MCKCSLLGRPRAKLGLVYQQSCLVICMIIRAIGWFMGCVEFNFLSTLPLFLIMNNVTIAVMALVAIICKVNTFAFVSSAMSMSCGVWYTYGLFIYCVCLYLVFCLCCALYIMPRGVSVSLQELRLLLCKVLFSLYVWLMMSYLVKSFNFYFGNSYIQLTHNNPTVFCARWQFYTLSKWRFSGDTIFIVILLSCVA